MTQKQKKAAAKAALNAVPAQAETPIAKAIEEDTPVKVVGSTPVTILAPEQAAEAVIRTMKLRGELHQRGLQYKDAQGATVLADPENNTFAKFEAEGTGDILPISVMAGSIANQLYVFGKRVKGLVKKAGFLLDLAIDITENGETTTLKVGTTMRLALTQPSDAASFIAQTLLMANEQTNAESLLTGNFEVSPEGQLLFKRLGFNAEVNGLPAYKRLDLLDAKRKTIKGNVSKTIKAQKAAGIIA